MSFSFALPGMLWALAALALPLLLHLVRRERQKRTVFAALAWLDPKQRPRRRLRFREWLLLLLRLGLVAALALWLAGLQQENPPSAERVVLVHPALSASSAAAPDVAVHWWAPGFPPASEPPPDAGADAASLLRAFDARLAATTALEVRVPAWLDGLDAAPIQLSRPVTWTVLPRPGPTAEAPTSPAPTLSLRGNPDDPALPWLRAVQAAWRAGQESPDDGHRAPPGATPPTHHDVLAWTSEEPPDAATIAWVAQGGTLLLDTRAPWPLARGAVPMAAPDWLHGAGHGAGRVLQWRVPLDAGSLPALLEPAFPSRLARALAPPPSPARAVAEAVAPQTGAPAPRPTPAPLDAPLLGLVLALFALERLLALGRSRSTAT